MQQKEDGMKNILSPSILAADFCKLGEQIKIIEKSGADYLHVDVMDGMFVPAISFGMPVIKSIRKGTDLFLDVHLMIEDPGRYVEEFARCGADLINFHLESTKDPMAVVEKIRSTGKKVGITIKPVTPVSAVLPYLDAVDMVLVMTVEPGFGGQSLMPDCLDKITELRRIADAQGRAVDIEIDGGVKLDNLKKVLEAGANVIVAGSGIFKGDLESELEKFLRVMNSI